MRMRYGNDLKVTMLKQLSYTNQDLTDMNIFYKNDNRL